MISFADLTLLFLMVQPLLSEIKINRICFQRCLHGENDIQLKGALCKITGIYVYINAIILQNLPVS